MWRLWFIFISTVPTFWANADESFCFKTYKKGIGVTFRNGFLYQDTTNQLINDDGFLNCLCRFRPCLSKCCRSDEVMYFGKCTKNKNTLYIKPYLWNQENVDYLFKTRIVNGIPLSPKQDPTLKFMFSDNGSLLLPLVEGEEQSVYGMEQYCVDLFYDEDFNGETVVLLSLGGREVGEIEVLEAKAKRFGKFCRFCHSYLVEVNYERVIFEEEIEKEELLWLLPSNCYYIFNLV